MTTPAQGPMVLIVDDDARMREVLARWLAAAAYETQEAADAETALEMLAATSVQAVLCDVTMPGRGGLWLVEQAREQFPAVAMVLATGVEHIHPSISLGGNVVDYLMKPFERAAVLTAVGQACAWHETALRNAGVARDDDDTLARWMRGGKPEPPEIK
jgi:DNA-binding NtrC family response regulator